MNWFTNEVKVLLFSLTVVVSGVLAAVQYTSLCSLQAVTLNGQKVENWERELGLVRSQGILKQPLDSLADALFARQGVRHVSIDYILPNTLHISTTNLTPICYVHDDVSGMLFGLDETARVVPLSNDVRDWELPICTGVRIRLLFDQCVDPRVSLVVPQLKELHAQRPDFFRLISEVSFANPSYLTVSISGLPCVVRALPIDLLVRLDEFVAFMEHYKAEPFGASVFDLRYDNMIVREAQPEKKRKDSASVVRAAQQEMQTPPATSSGPVFAKPKSPTVAPVKGSGSHRKAAPARPAVIKTGNHPTASPKASSLGKPNSPSRPMSPVTPKKTDRTLKESAKAKKVTANGR